MYKLIIMALIVLVACGRKPFVELKVDLVKNSTDCSKIQNTFKLESNFGGERFTFQKCLPGDYQKSNVTSGRAGDTVLVNFTKTSGGANSEVFDVTVDVDSYPEYNFVNIDGDTYVILHSK